MRKWIFIKTALIFEMKVVCLLIFMFILNILNIVFKYKQKFFFFFFLILLVKNFYFSIKNSILYKVNFIMSK